MKGGLGWNDGVYTDFFTPSESAKSLQVYPGKIPVETSQLAAQKAVPVSTKSVEVIKALQANGFKEKLRLEERIQLFLDSSSILYSKVLFELLPIHVNQLAFLHRKTIKFRGATALLVFRTLLADGDETACGWFWLSRYSAENIRDAMIYKVFHDQNKLVRSRGSNYLPVLWNRKVAAKFVSTYSEEEKDIVLHRLWVLGEQGPEASVPSILSILKSSQIPEIKKGAWEALWKLYSRCKKNEALRFAITYKPEKYGVLELSMPKLAMLLKRADAHDIAALKESVLESIKIAALIEEVNRGVSDPTVMKQYLSTKNTQTRVNVIEVLVKHGVITSLVEFDETIKKIDANPFWGLFGLRDRLHKIRESLIGTPSIEMLEAVDIWLDKSGPDYYEKYGLSADKSFLAQVRCDFNDNYSRFRKRYLDYTADMLFQAYQIEKVKNLGQPGVDNGEKTKEYFVPSAEAKLASIDKYITERYIDSAISILAKRGDESDLLMLRKLPFEKFSRFTEDILNMYKRYGTEKDADLVAEYAIRLHIPFKQKAAAIALKLDKKRSVYKKLISTDDVLLIKSVLGESGVPVKEKRVLCERILMHKDESLRKVGFAWLITRMKKKYLEDQLGRYLRQSTYYYNMVCWLDRCLYSPKYLRSSYLKHMKLALLDNTVSLYSVAGEGIGDAVS